MHIQKITQNSYIYINKKNQFQDRFHQVAMVMLSQQATSTMSPEIEIQLWKLLIVATTPQIVA